MSELDRLERDLTVWFAETGVPRTPPYLDDILRQTAHRGQRPRWTFLERLLPMSTTTSFRAVRAGVPWRPLAAVALLIVLLLLAVLVAGSTQQRLPAPFGPAAAGLVAYASDGDIFVAHPTTGEVRAIVTGPDADRDPQWSRDGTRIVFERAESGLVRLFTVRPDGSELTPIVSTPLNIQDDPDGPRYTFSPDGRSILFIADAKLQIARTDGSGIKTIEIPGVAALEAGWRPPDGSQIGVVGQLGGLYLVDTTTGSMRTLVRMDATREASGPRWSPDGSQIAYYPWTGTANVFTVRGRIVDIATGVSRLADPHGDDVFWDAGAAWSNDGQRLAIFRGHTDGYSDVTIAILRADGTGPRVETAHGLGLSAGCCAAFEWAPDDSWLLVTPVDAADRPQPQLLIDPNTGSVTTPHWQAISDPAWQRLAP